MSGVVEWESLIWIIGVIGAAGTGVSVFLVFLYKVVKARESDLRSQFHARDEQIALLEAARKLGEERIAREFANYREHVGETFATKSGVNGAIERIEGMMMRLTERLDTSFERLMDRLDRIVDQQRPGPRRLSSKPDKDPEG